MGTSVINALKYKRFTTGEPGTRGQRSGSRQDGTRDLKVQACARPTQWSCASSSYFSQNLSVKGMQVRNSHHSQRTG